MLAVLRNVLTADQGRMLEEGSLDLGFLRMPFAGSPGVLIDSLPVARFMPNSHVRLLQRYLLYSCPFSSYTSSEVAESVSSG